jgi:hypothetical protein
MWLVDFISADHTSSCERSVPDARKTHYQGYVMISPATNLPFTSVDTDRLLGLADSFLEDWGQSEADESAEFRDPDYPERCKEWDAIRPLLVAAPIMLSLIAELISCADPQRDFKEIKQARDLVRDLG